MFSKIKLVGCASLTPIYNFIVLIMFNYIEHLTVFSEGTGGTKQQDGYFLLRPSTTHVGNPLTLVLWYKDRVYNVPVRKRRDNRYENTSLITRDNHFANIFRPYIFIH